jgi:hypothetical protein
MKASLYRPSTRFCCIDKIWSLPTPFSDTHQPLWDTGKLVELEIEHKNGQDMTTYIVFERGESFCPGSQAK